MKNELVINRLTGIQHALMAQHLGGKGMPNASSGSEREVFLRVFLAQVFPSHFRFTSGAITDSDARRSGQVDIAVETPFFPSFPLPNSPERLMLAESVAAVIEVKSDLSGQWGQLQSTVREIRPLRRYLHGTVQTGSQLPSFDLGSIPVIAVAYTGHTTIDGLRQRLATTPESGRPHAALVISSGVFIGFGMEAHGAIGLFAFCRALHEILAAVSVAHCNLLRYAT